MLKPGNMFLGQWRAMVKMKSPIYDSMSDLGEIEVYQRADFQSGSRVLKKVF